MPVQTIQPPPVRNQFIAPGTPGISRPWLEWLRDQIFRAINNQAVAINGQGVVILDTHASRLANHPAANYPAGSEFYETDRKVYYINSGSSWVYLAGVMAGTQLQLPGDLGATDAGFLYMVTDYAHVLRWTGFQWEWGPGDSGSGYIAGFLSDPGTGWALCDGSTVARLNADGTVSNVTLPNYTTEAYVKFATAAAATPAAASGTSDTAAPGTSAAIGTTDVQSGTGATVASSTHVHTVNSHSHGPGTLELRRTVLKAYFRQ